MNLDNIIRFEQMEKEGLYMSKLTFLSVFSLGILVSTKSGSHMTISLGIGPLEFETGLRLWLTGTR